MALYFHLQNEKDGDLLLLEQEIDRYVDGVELLTAVHLSNEVERVLSRIPSGVNNVAKRELARALGRGQRTAEHGEGHHHQTQFVRPSTFYNKTNPGCTIRVPRHHGNRDQAVPQVGQPPRGAGVGRQTAGMARDDSRKGQADGYGR